MELVKQSVSMLNEWDSWLVANRDGIQSKIEEGYAVAQRGELLSADEARAKLAELKRKISS